MKSFYYLLTLCTGLLMYSCSGKSAADIMRDSLKAREDILFDSIMTSKNTNYVDSSCHYRLQSIMTASPIDKEKLDSIIKAGIKINCYCTMNGSREKLGAKIPIVKDFIKNKYVDYTYHMTPLQSATINQDIDVMKMLLENGADANMSETVRDKPMAVAMRLHDDKLIDLLAKYNGNLKGCYINVKFISLKEMKRYANYGADYNIADDFFQVPPLQEADDHDKMAFLLKWGANPNDTAKGGDNLLHHLVIWGDESDIDLALKYKADLYARNGRGHTPLHVAAGQFNTDMLAKLLPLYDLKKAGITIDELIALSEKEGDGKCVAYLKSKK